MVRLRGKKTAWLYIPNYLQLCCVKHNQSLLGFYLAMTSLTYSTLVDKVSWKDIGFYEMIHVVSHVSADYNLSIS